MRGDKDVFVGYCWTLVLLCFLLLGDMNANMPVTLSFFLLQSSIFVPRTRDLILSHNLDVPHDSMQMTSYELLKEAVPSHKIKDMSLVVIHYMIISAST